MTQDTEDVVARILRDYESGEMDAAGTIEDLVEHAQSLSDRIDGLEAALKPFAEKAEYADALDAADDDYVDCAPDKAGFYRQARAALHHEGIAP